MASRRQIELMAIARARAEEAPEMETEDKLIAAASEFGEGATGFGTEIASIMRAGGSLNPFKAAGGMLGSAVGGMFRDDLSAEEAFGQMSDSYSKAESEIRAMQDQFEEESPVLSDAAAGAGMAAGLLIPGATLAKGGKAARAGLTAAEGALYGAGSDDNRAEGAALGAVLGGSIGVIGGKVADWAAKRADLKPSELAEAGDELVETAVKQGGWTDRTQEGWSSAWARVATGVSDSLSRRVSPEIGGRVQRADETASRFNNIDTKEIMETPAMRKVLELEAGDKEFKGLLLDFGRHSGDTTKLTNYVKKALGDEEAQALSKYLRWSMVNNGKFNKKLGNNADPTGYLHTQKRTGLPGSKPLPQKEQIGEFGDDVLNAPADQAAKDRQRGLFSKGEVNPDQYESVLLTNANRIFNNRRLLELQDKFRIKDINGGASGLMDAIEKTATKKGISEEGAREARNTIVSLLKGQNKSPNVAIKTFQNLGYSVLGGPKTAVLNFHDVPVALWNNGVKSARGLLKDAQERGADVERLGIDAQGVGEFVQRMRRNSLDQGWGAKAEDLSQKYTDTVLKVGFFQKLDRVAKNQTLKVVADDTISRANAGTLAERWGAFFEADDLAHIQRAVRESGGDINKMDPKGQKLYDEMLTLGLGQQQLISAAGRPIEWLNRPNFRPLWMMRGFAVKHNHIISEKVHRKWKAGDKAGAVAEAGKYVMLPGASYAAMNVGRNELFKEDYEPSGEEFMWSLADSVLGPITLNAVGVGSSYARSEYEKDTWRAIAQAAIPPGGVGKDVVNGVYKAVANQDEEELEKIVTSQPIFKQWAAFIEQVD